MQQAQACDEHDAITAYRAMIRSHYAPNEERGDIAHEAYTTACAFIQTELQGSNDAKALLQKGHSIEEVYALVEQAKARQDEKSGRKILKWLGKLSARISYYGKVMDVLAQHHPEYVALVWGAVKFVLIGILNHECLVTEFSRALAEIGGALREVSLAVELFQTSDMHSLLSQLYAHILIFSQHAIKWYKRSRIGRAFSSVFSPYELKYEDTVEQIRLCARSMKNLGDTKNWAEVRDLNMSIELLRRDVTQLQETADSSLKIATCNRTLSERIHIDIQDMRSDTRDLRLSYILDALKPRFCPHESLAKLQSIAKRSRSLRLPSAEPTNVIQSLNNWFSREGSSLFLLRVGTRAEAKAREIMTDIISFLQKKKFKVIWRVSPPQASVDSSEPSSFIEVIQALIYQAMLLEPTIYLGFNITSFRTTHTESEWISLFHTLFSRLPKCYIIIEARDLFQANKEDQAWRTAFLSFFQELAHGAATKGHALKFLVLCYGTRMETDGFGDFGALLTKPSLVPMRCKKMVQHKRGLQGWKGVQPKL